MVIETEESLKVFLRISNLGDNQGVTQVKRKSNEGTHGRIESCDVYPLQRPNAADCQIELKRTKRVSSAAASKTSPGLHL